MDKRIIFAIGLSLLVLILWTVIFPAPKMQPAVNKEVIAKTELTPAPIIPAQISQDSTFFTVQTDFLELKFGLPSASIQDIKFKKFSNYQPKNIARIGQLLAKGKELEFTDYKIAGDKITFTSKDGNVIKSFIVSNSSYSIELGITGLNKKIDNLDCAVSIACLDIDKYAKEARSTELIILANEKITKTSLLRFKNQVKTITEDKLSVVGIKGSHFCYLLKNKELGKIFYQIIGDTKGVLRITQGVSNKNYQLFLGPIDPNYLNNFDNAISGNLTHFNAIANILLKILDFLHKIVRNWGVAIILLSLLIYGLLYPLTHKQMQSVKEMQALQPHIDNLRKIYKDNPQRLNKEILELYKEHKVNPLGGCLPLILQIPVFFALYQALSRSLLLKGAKFLWIKDLTEPDKLFMLKNNLPIIGNEINLLPILMAVVMFLQQKLSLKTASPSQKEQQQMMMVLFPILFGFIFYSFPSGLVIYWFINSLLTFVYQWKVSK